VRRLADLRRRRVGTGLSARALQRQTPHGKRATALRDSPQHDPTCKPSFWPALVTRQTPFAEHNATTEHRLEHYRAGHLRRPRSALEALEELLVLALPGRCCSDVLQWTESEPRSRSACGPHLQRLVHVELPCLVHKVLAISRRYLS